MMYLRRTSESPFQRVCLETRENNGKHGHRWPVLRNHPKKKKKKTFPSLAGPFIDLPFKLFQKSVWSQRCYGTITQTYLAAPPEEVNTTIIAALTLIAARTFTNTSNSLWQCLLEKNKKKKSGERDFFVPQMKQQTRHETYVLRDISQFSWSEEVDYKHFRPKTWQEIHFTWLNQYLGLKFY